jgi:transcriptional regulator with XRE-family HTH domain
MLQISQHALAEASGVSARAIADFEAENRQPIRATSAALRRALEEAGVEFTDGDPPGLRLKKRKTAKR